MTKFINRGRGSGKSIMLIHAAYVTDSPIIVFDYQRKKQLIKQAQDMKCDDVEVFTLEEWTNMRVIPNRAKKVYIDEALPIIDKIMSKTLEANVLAATFTLPMEEVPKQNEKST